MEGLFKLIFYVIIIIFWAIANSKKQENWDEDLSGQTKPKPEQFKKPVPRPTIIHPEGGDIFKLNERSEDTPDLSTMTYEQFSEIRHKKAIAKKTARQKKQPEPVFEPELIKKAGKKFPESTHQRLNQTKKPTFILKSRIKEGIIWSIILGPPRSRERLNCNASRIVR